MSTPHEPDVLWLDGVTSEAIVLPPPESARTALGADPFEAPVAIDPFGDRLEALASWNRPARSRERPKPGGRLRAPRLESPAPRRPDRDRSRRRAHVPRLADVELAEPRGLIERLLAPDERRRLEALQHLLDGDAPYDRYGFSPRATQQAFPLFFALHKLYFRARSQGGDHIPTSGPAVLASNHAGLLPFDAAMLVVDILLRTDPPRLARTVVDRWAGRLPWVNLFFARVGQIVGTSENVADVLDDDQLLLVFPEGIAGVQKTITQRYRVQRFRCGFVEHALRAGAPIVPTAVVGSDDQMPVIFDLKTIARLLGTPSFPITPTFPWFGPLGLLPYPVRYRIVYGEPLAFHERFGPEGADDPRLVRYLANRVRREVQLLLDRNRS